ncbi:MAG: hypothetical protein HQ548_03605 [Chloroflexi bacterium]|nr:hypothetical protein [Chloroflexota bacterium]
MAIWYHGFRSKKPIKAENVHDLIAQLPNETEDDRSHNAGLQDAVLRREFEKWRRLQKENDSPDEDGSDGAADDGDETADGGEDT